VSAGTIGTPSRVLTPIRMVGVGELKQLNGCAVFDDEHDAHAVGWAVRRKQNLPTYRSYARSLTSKATCGACRTNSGIGASLRFEPHPCDAILAVFVSNNNKGLQMFDGALSQSRLAGRNSNVGTRTRACAQIRP
jgi:hypothetical protein